MKPAALQDRLINRKVIAKGSWLQLETIAYRDPEGCERHWEAAERCGSSQAAVMIATLRPSGRVVLIQQYRPPADADVLEFPAGLVDAGETAAEAGLRELHEETGYVGTVRQTFPPCYNTPGMTSEAAAVIVVDIDESSPENQHPSPKNHEGEYITVFTVHPDDMADFLNERQAHGVHIDSKIIMRFLDALA